MSTTKLRFWGALAVVIVVAISATAMTSTEAISKRQKEMEGVRAGMMNLAAIAKKEQPFDADVVQANAGKIANHLMQSEQLFPEGSNDGEVQTWAKAEIWSDREKFDGLMESTHQAAVALQSVTEAEAFGPALGKLGFGCKSCHDLYRLPKD
jgi:cytochrome c556